MYCMRPGVRYRKKGATGGIEAISEHWEIVIRKGSVSCSAHERRIFLAKLWGWDPIYMSCGVVAIREFFFSSHFLRL